MIKRLAFGAVLLLAVPLPAFAQVESPQVAFVYATYFECDPSTEARADEIIQRSYAPHYDAAVESGDILAWSWLAHFVGGKWRRALVLSAPNMDSLLDASGALGEIIEESTPETGRAFSEICPVHEDYVWETAPGLASAPPAGGGGDVRFSTYLTCDPSREERANQLFRDNLAPVYDRHVAQGELTGWAMLNHNVGGEYRRLLTMAAGDHKAMMRARAAIVDEIRNGRAQRAFGQINEICGPHQDYMWDVQLQTP